MFRGTSRALENDELMWDIFETCFLSWPSQQKYYLVLKVFVHLSRFLFA